MQPTYIVSSNIDAIAHQAKQLFIRFKSGITYSYDDVPYDYFDALQKVESAGKFFHQFIKNRFTHHRLEGDPFRAG